ncbi:hypothetical protein M758_9G071000 [Ceratodon purpureus]|nr:hypothetical protein M758_9G071000 [Ceratodon purpureus]
MATHAIKLASPSDSLRLTVKNMHDAKLRGNHKPARTRRNQQSLNVTMKVAVACPDSSDQHFTFGSNVGTMKDEVWISTQPKVDHGETPKSSNWAISLCDTLEKKTMSWALGNDTCEKKECYLLSDNYAPVEEMAPTTDLPVIGTIPACMNGMFARNGPNPKFKPLGGYHWFDGDGMIHGLNIKDGKATYVARYVQTAKLQQEERYGASKFFKVGDLKGIPGYFVVALQLLRRILGVLDCSNGYGTGNTSLVFHNKKLLALHEQDKPYNIKVSEDGDLHTIGLEDFKQKLKHPFTAHPKIDPITGEMFLFTYQFLAPHLIYRVVSKDGIAGEPVPISMPGPVLMHDFAISENYACFMDLPLLLNPMGLATGGFVFKFDPSKETRLGLLPRNATSGSQIRWFKIPPCFVTHTVNAWEEGDEVILTCCRKDDIDLHPEQVFKKERAWALSARLYEFRMNLKTGNVKHSQLSNLCTEYPRINPEYTGRKTSFAYCAIFDETDKITGVVKYDLRKESSSAESRELKAGVFEYGTGRVGGEAIFVPRNSGMDGPEDDGYLISFVHDEINETSEVIIIDAKTMDPEPVAVVKLPRRVPHGFHAHFVSEEQLRQQA